MYGGDRRAAGGRLRQRDDDGGRDQYGQLCEHGSGDHPIELQQSDNDGQLDSVEHDLDLDLDIDERRRGDRRSCRDVQVADGQCRLHDHRRDGPLRSAQSLLVSAGETQQVPEDRRLRPGADRHRLGSRPSCLRRRHGDGSEREGRALRHRHGRRLVPLPEPGERDDMHEHKLWPRILHLVPELPCVLSASAAGRSALTDRRVGGGTIRG